MRRGESLGEDLKSTQQVFWPADRRERGSYAAMQLCTYAPMQLLLGVVARPYGRSSLIKDFAMDSAAGGVPCELSRSFVSTRT